MMKNKKGFILTIPILIIGAILIILILLGLNSFVNENKLLLIGLTIIILTFIYVLPASVQGDLTNKKIALVVILFLFGAIFIVFQYTPFIMQAVLPSYLSIDRVENVGVGSEFLVFSTIGSSEVLKIDWDASDFNNKINPKGYMVDRGVNLDVELTEWSHTFPIIHNPNKQFFEFGVQDIVPFVGVEAFCELDDCNEKLTESEKVPGATYVAIYHEDTIPLYQCKCVWSIPVASVGEFSSGISYLDYNLNFDTGTESKNLQRGTSSVNLENGNLRAEFVGTFGNIDQINNPGYDVLRKDGVYTHLISDEAHSTDGINLPSSWLYDCEPPEGTFFNYEPYHVPELLNCIGTYNSLSHSADNSKNSEYTGLTGGTLSFSSQNMKLDTPTLDFKPAFKLFIKADWIGLKELSGKPSITNCAGDIDTNSITKKNTKIKIKNIGDKTGQFEYVSVCSDSDASFYMSETLTSLNSGEEKEFNLVFSGSNDNPSSDLTGTCTHKVRDIKSGIEDTCISNFNVEYTADGFCAPDSERCNPTDEKIWEKCKSDGTSYEIVKTCAIKCEYNPDGKTFQCKEGLETKEKKNVSEETNLTCRWFEESYSITTEEEDCGAFQWRAWLPFAECKTYTKKVEGCRTAGWIWGVLLGIFALLIVIMLFVLLTPRKKKKGGRK